jgi:sucrose-6-phosphate hydrolase SacC (GH32 family)
MLLTRLKLSLLGLLLMCATTYAFAQGDPRATALAYWYLGDGIGGDTPALTTSGGISYNVTPAGRGTNPLRRAAQLSSAYFNAGTSLSISGQQLTVYLRLRDPAGTWNSGLLAKRGTHDTLNYNLFCTDLAGTTGTDIGFEVHTSHGFASVSFPVSQIDATAWHNLVGRYDGQTLALFCNDRLMASAPLTGTLTTNSEPTLIGAETDNGAIVRPFTGQIEEAALWNVALSDADVARLAGRASTLPWPSATLHYKHPDHAVGDMHAKYINGEWILTYMHTPSDWGQAQIRSTDLFHWTWYNPTHAAVSGSDQYAAWFAIEYLWDPYLQKYRSIWGYNGMRSSVSIDLLNWSSAVPQLLLPDPGLYNRFSDPFIGPTGDNAWMMVITLAKKNQPWETGGAIGYATSSNLTSWVFRGDLYYPGNRGVPEVPSFFKLGSKWYLLASWYDQAVGRPSYLAADAPTGPWTAFTPESLDGKDVCAAVSDSDGQRRLLFGWIPLVASQPGNQYWGGHVCFPRELTQLPSGALRTRLPADFSRGLRGALSYPLFNATAFPRSGAWSSNGATLQLNSTATGNRATLPGLYDRFDAQMDITLSTGATRAGLLLDWDGSGEFFEVGLNATTQRLEIRSAVAGTVHADLAVPVAQGTPHTLRVIVEQDMVEAFLDDAFTLAARIPKKLATTSLGVYTDGGPVTFNNLNVYRLRNLDQIHLGNSAANPRCALYE